MLSVPPSDFVQLSGGGQIANIVSYCLGIDHTGSVAFGTTSIRPTPAAATTRAHMPTDNFNQVNTDW